MQFSTRETERVVGSTEIEIVRGAGKVLKGERVTLARQGVSQAVIQQDV